MTLIRLKDEDSMTHLINLESVTVSLRKFNGAFKVVVILHHGVEIILYDDTDQTKAEDLIDRIFKVQFDSKVMLAQRDKLVDMVSKYTI